VQLNKDIHTQEITLENSNRRVYANLICYFGEVNELK